MLISRQITSFFKFLNFKSNSAGFDTSLQQPPGHLEYSQISSVSRFVKSHSFCCVAHSFCCTVQRWIYHFFVHFLYKLVKANEARFCIILLLNIINQHWRKFVVTCNFLSKLVFNALKIWKRKCQKSCFLSRKNDFFYIY